jgi:hypothetical protein
MYSQKTKFKPDKKAKQMKPVDTKSPYGKSQFQPELFLKKEKIKQSDIFEMKSSKSKTNKKKSK